MENKKIVNISRNTFISVVVILFVLIVMSIGLTYLIPKGVMVDGTYQVIENAKGISIWKGLLSPFLVLGSSDGLTLIVLCIFLMVVTGIFQVLTDTNGIRMIVNRLISKFENKKKLLIAIIVLVFMCFGSFFGLYEETLALLPLIITITLSLGYDSYTAFLICTIATGFGFSVAMTNPFTIIVACELIGASVIKGMWFRALTLIIVYFLLLGFVFLHIKRIEKNKEKSPTYLSDLEKNSDLEKDISYDKKIYRSNLFFLLSILVTIILFTLVPFLSGYTVIGLIVVFLVGGLIVGNINTKGNFKIVLSSFKKGLVSVVPAILLVLMASSIKYILVEGQIIDTITNYMITLTTGKSTILAIFVILVAVLVLEFFISSSTAKAIIVMGVLGGLIGSINVSKELLVLIYTYGDGFTNTIFPTSPVLLIALSVTGMSYFKWIKKSSLLFAVLAILVVIFLLCAYLISY